jgi:predicted TIM-barrel fold metal-dependent hydrolase
VHATFQDDPVALHNIEYTGTDAVLWGNDYPHEEGTYPHSRDIVERLAREVDADTARRVFRDNAARVFGFDEKTIDKPIEDVTLSS